MLKQIIISNCHLHAQIHPRFANILHTDSVKYDQTPLKRIKSENYIV